MQRQRPQQLEIAIEAFPFERSSGGSRVVDGVARVSDNPQSTCRSFRPASKRAKHVCEFSTLARMFQSTRKRIGVHEKSAPLSLARMDATTVSWQSE
jgi:hypothetical protein